MSASSSTARADKHQCDHRQHPPTKALPLPRVVRRVQAVIEFPVKEEEVEEECCGLDTVWPPDAGVLHPTSTDYVDEGKEAPSDEASGGIRGRRGGRERVDDVCQLEGASSSSLTSRIPLLDTVGFIK